MYRYLGGPPGGATWWLSCTFCIVCVCIISYIPTCSFVMLASCRNLACGWSKVYRDGISNILFPVVFSNNTIQVRYRRNTKHWNPQFRVERRKKFLKVKLPDYEERRKEAEMTPEEIRLKMKEKGIQPPRYWMERPINISSSGGVFEPYVPPEGDGKMSLVSLPGAKQRIEKFEKKGKSMLAVRKIRKYDEDFELHPFAEQAQEIYIEAHKALTRRDEDKLHDTVTEKCYPEMTDEMKKRTIRWTFLESLEPPRVVHARCTEVMSKENIYAQVTVRMHTRQTLAIYDRFGRLMYGNPVVAKDVLEYVVFEKHLSNQYGIWRIHGKIVPEWMTPKDSFHKTFVRNVPPVQEVQNTT